MFIKDLKAEFYNVLCANRSSVLILVSREVDALCACGALQSLLRADGVPHTVVGVGGLSELRSAYHCHASPGLLAVLLINCGATCDLLELLQPEEDVTFYILDSHRPIDVCNAYSDAQVKIVWRDGDDIPEFEDIFNDEYESDAEEDVEAGSAESRLSALEGRAEKRRQRRAWETNRDKIMFEYTQFSYYGKSSAVVVFELARQLSRDSSSLLWLAAVGATEQLLLEKAAPAHHILETGVLQSHAARLAVREGQQGAEAAVSLAKQPRLALYRHWSVEASLRYSPYTAAQLKLWTLRGDKFLHRLLVDMGLPLAQARQAYSSMDLELRNEFLPSLEKLGQKYSLPDIVILSFSLQRGYSSKFTSSDFVYALLALLEHGGAGPAERFQSALSALSITSLDEDGGAELRRGLETAKRLLTSAGRAVQAALEGHALLNVGPFQYVLLPEVTCSWMGPHWLGVAARWAQRCAGRSSLPLLAAVPQISPVSSQASVTQAEATSSTCLLLGVPPMADDSTRNLFGRAFEQAANKSQSAVSRDPFDSSIISIETDHISKFLDALTALLS